VKLLRAVKISHKIPIAIILFIILPLVISYIAIQSTASINKGGQVIYDNYFVSVVNLTDVRKYLYKEYVLLKSHIIAPDDVTMKSLEQQITQNSIDLNKSLILFEETLDIGEETKNLKLFKSSLKNSQEIRSKIIALSQINSDVEAESTINTQFNFVFTQMQTQIDAMFNTNIAGANHHYAENSNQFDELQLYIFIITAALIAIGLLTGWALIYSIVLPLKKMQKHIVLYTHSGEITTALDIVGKDEISTLSQSFNAMWQSLSNAQEDIIQSEKLSSLGSLVAGVSHEINTPLGIAVTIGTAIKQQVEEFVPLLKSGKMKHSNLDAFEKQLLEGFELLLPSLEKASTLIHNFKQVAVDQTSEIRRNFKLAEVVQETFATLHHKIKRTEIICDIDIDDDITMDSYPGALGQIITNLFNNALIHGFDDLNQGNIQIIAHQQNMQVILTISDDGKGISDENLSKVFDPFFTTKLGKGGSGLGLNIIYNLITSVMGGDIKVTNEDRTTFVLTLPLIAPSKGQFNDR